MHTIKKIAPIALMLCPFVAMAAQTFEQIITQIGGIFAMIVPILIAFALIVFIVGVIRYVTAGDSEDKRAAARNTIIYGVIGLFAIVAVWGLVEIIRTTFGITEQSTALPLVPTP